jgi:hypothetical protein
VVLGLVVFYSLNGVGQPPFITTWKTDNDGTSCSSCIITPPLFKEFYKYELCSFFHPKRHLKIYKEKLISIKTKNYV